MEKDYEVKGITTVIKATSRVALKLRENYYTLEHSEERSIPDVEGVDMNAERHALWDSVNGILDDMIEETYHAVMKK